MGVGTLAVGTAGVLPAASSAREPGAVAEDEMIRVTLLINGRRHRCLLSPAGRSSSSFGKAGADGNQGRLRARRVRGLHGPHRRATPLCLHDPGCGGEGKEITTLEGLMKGEELGPVQQAFLEHDAFQCGYCTPGQIMAVEGLLRAKSQSRPWRRSAGGSAVTSAAAEPMPIFLRRPARR